VLGFLENLSDPKSGSYVLGLGSDVVDTVQDERRKGFD
jgi:hypothetical protein